MQSVSSKIWTHVAVSNSCDDNHYTTGTFSGYSTSTKALSAAAARDAQLQA